MTDNDKKIILAAHSAIARELIRIMRSGEESSEDFVASLNESFDALETLSTYLVSEN